MAAKVEPVTVADLGAGEPPDLRTGLEDSHRDAASREQVARGEARRTGTENQMCACLRHLRPQAAEF
jgi:hypothetical protein